MNAIQELNITNWQADVAANVSETAIDALENGQVLVLPQLPFVLSADEQRFLSTTWSDGKAKNISLQPKDGRVVFKGAQGSAQDLTALQSMIQRYADSAETLVMNLFPAYREHIKRANTSFRPFAIEGRVSSYRKDDTRLHADSFPSNPTCGTRLLRVFCNVNPVGLPRTWRVGEPFADMAHRFLPTTRGLFPLQSWLMHRLKITKRPRTEYDHRMLQLHDNMKADLDYQRNAPQQTVHIMPGTTWIVYSDQVLHAAMSGQHMFEQTFHVPVAALYHPERSPLHVLESMLNQKLI